MSADWPRVPLGELLIERRERVGTPDASALPLLGVSNAEGLHRSVKERIADMSRYFHVRRDWFAYNPMRINVGSIGWAETEEQTGVISPDYVVFSCGERILSGLLYLYLRSRVGLDAINSGTAGSVRERLYFDSLGRINFPLPPLAEQQRVVARVDAIASRVAAARRLRDEITAEQSRFVTGVHHKLAGERVVPIGSFLQLHEVKENVVPEGRYPQVGVRGFGGGLFAKEVTEGTATTYGAFNTLFAGAVVLSQVKGWEGAVAVCPSNLAGWFVSPEYRTFRCYPSEADADYLTELVRTQWFWERLAEPTRGVGARRERVRPELVLPLRLPMPTLEQQRHAVKMFAEFDALRSLQASTATELDAVLPSVLNRAFAGDL